jgi:ABC-type branched-subunit amino acid transport system ATPase component
MDRELGAKTMALICLNPLTERCGPVLAVDDVTGTLQPGRITGFGGPNGAGTTATLRMPVDAGGDKPAGDPRPNPPR